MENYHNNSKEPHVYRFSYMDVERYEDSYRDIGSVYDCVSDDYVHTTPPYDYSFEYVAKETPYCRY